MPTYDYRCTNPDCLHEQVEFHGIRESGAPTCDSCGYPMKKLMSPVPHKFNQKRGTMGVSHGDSGIREPLT